jgi:polar amino acid transport system substrate-binding protein
MHIRHCGFVVVAAILASMGMAEAQQVLKVAGQDAEPYVVRDKASGVLSGIAVEFINALGKDAGFQVEYQPMINADLIPALTSGKIDIIASNLVITPERKQQVDFADPYYMAPGDALVSAKSDPTPYRALADLKGVAVGALKSSPHVNLLERTGGFSAVKVYDKLEDAWTAIGAGQIKVVLGPMSTTAYKSKTGQLPVDVQMVASYQPVMLSPIGLAVKKGNSQLLERINKSQSKLAADGALKAIYTKYGFDWTQPK